MALPRRNNAWYTYQRSFEKWRKEWLAYCAKADAKRQERRRAQDVVAEGEGSGAGAG